MGNIEIVGDKKIWLDLCHRVSLFKENVFFEITAEEVHVRDVDDGHVSLIDVVVFPKAFTKYVVNGHNLLSMDVSVFLKMLDLLGDKVCFVYDGKQIVLSDDDRSVSMKLWNDQYKEIPHVDLKSDFEIILSSDDLKSILNTAKVFERVRFKVKGKQFFIEADSDKAKFEGLLSRKAKKLVKDVKETSSMFSSDYLINVLKTVMNDNEDVVVRVGMDAPLRFDVVTKYGRVYVLLAPCLEG